MFINVYTREEWKAFCGTEEGAAELKELRDGLQPFAGRMPNLAG